MNHDFAGEAITTELRPSSKAGVDASWVATLAALSVIAVAFVALYWRAASAAVLVWYGSAAYNHGFLILPMVGYLIWERRATIAEMAPAPLPWVLLLVPALGAVWLVAYLVGVNEAQQFLLVAMLQIVLLAMLGYRVYRALAFPLLYMFFLVPSGEFLVPWLQDFTARFSVEALRLSGVPVFSDGFRISIPNAEFYIAEACAGLRFLIATIAFGVLFAYFMFRSWPRKLLFVALCLVTPVIANGLRAYGIILLAYLTDGALAAGVDHIVYGWVFFSLVTLGLTALGWAMRDVPEMEPPPRRQSRPPAGTGRVLVTALLALAALGLPRAYAAYLEYLPPSHAKLELALGAPAAPWQVEPGPGDWTPRFAAADGTMQQSFGAGDEHAQLFIAYYRNQNQDKKLVSFENSLNGTANEREWEIIARASVTVTLDGERTPFAASLYANHGKKRLILSTYWVDGQFESRSTFEKLRQARAQLAGGPREAALLALATDFSDDADEALRRLRDLAAHLPPLKPMLKAARQN